MRILNQFDLRGKTALVTGCRRGIGKAIAIALADAGADIVGVSANLEPERSEVEQSVRAFGRIFSSYACDFSNRAALYQFIAQVKRDYPRLDILVNNAGVVRRQPAVDHADDIWDEVLETNLSAQFVLAREIAREMLARRSGKIIFIASLAAFQGGVTIPGYAASKGGIAQLTKALANEWAGQGVNVNAIAPGYVATEFTAALQQDPKRFEQIVARIPAGRWATPEDFQGAAVFLASDASAYLHGAILVVDGGWMGR